MKWGCGLAQIRLPVVLILMQHAGIRVYTRLQELRIIEILAGLEWASYDILGHSCRRKTLI